MLLPGLFVRVRVPTQRDVEALLVPDRALGNGQQGRYVLVVNDKNIVEQRPVETGDAVDGGLRIIKSGLQPEDRVVVSGIQRAVPGSVVKPVDVAPAPGPRGPCRAGTGPRGCACCAQGQAMIAKFFIERPVLANVIAVLTIILGLVALARLPVAQYPNIVPPTVQVTARYPGASAATVVRDVALPIEQKVNGVEGMIYMSSMSTSDGTYTLTVTFRIGTDADKAQILVQNRVIERAAGAAAEPCRRRACRPPSARPRSSRSWR